MKKMKKSELRKKIVAALGCSLLLICINGCKSTELSESFELPDYTIEDVKKEEIKRIEEIGETDCVQAYWRAFLLKDQKTLEKCEENVFAEYKKALEEKKWLEARRLCYALEYLGGAQNKKLEKNTDELDSLCLEALKSFGSDKNSGKKVSELIKGTVTVWVDKGIKVENGMGYADRVIGSGFFISKDGYIVTNHHVIVDLVNPKYEGYARLYVKLAEDSETRVPAKVVAGTAALTLLC